MSNEPQPTNPNKVARSGSGAGSTVAIVIAAVAVVLGLLILKKLNDNDGSASPPPSNSVTTSTPTDSSTPGETSSVPPPPVDVKTGSKVQVANASQQNQVAGKLTTVLANEGFQMGTAVTATGDKYAETVVLYTEGDTAAQAVAETLARTLGGVQTQHMTPPLPIKTGKLEDGVGVLVMLGTDRANKTLAEMQAMAATTTVTSAPAAESTTTTTTTG